MGNLFWFQLNNDDVLNPKREVDNVLVIGDKILLVYIKKEISFEGETTAFQGYFDEEVVVVKRVPQNLGMREVDIVKKYYHQIVVAYHGK